MYHIGWSIYQNKMLGNGIGYITSEIQIEIFINVFIHFSTSP